MCVLKFMFDERTVFIGQLIFLMKGICIAGHICPDIKDFVLMYFRGKRSQRPDPSSREKARNGALAVAHISLSLSLPLRPLELKDRAVRSTSTPSPNEEHLPQLLMTPNVEQTGDLPGGHLRHVDPSH